MRFKFLPISTFQSPFKNYNSCTVCHIALVSFCFHSCDRLSLRTWHIGWCIPPDPWMFTALYDKCTWSRRDVSVVIELLGSYHTFGARLWICLHLSPNPSSLLVQNVDLHGDPLSHIDYPCCVVSSRGGEQRRNEWTIRKDNKHFVQKQASRIKSEICPSFVQLHLITAAAVENLDEIPLFCTHTLTLCQSVLSMSLFRRQIRSEGTSTLQINVSSMGYFWEVWVAATLCWSY